MPADSNSESLVASTTVEASSKSSSGQLPAFATRPSWTDGERRSHAPGPRATASTKVRAAPRASPSTTRVVTSPIASRARSSSGSGRSASPMSGASWEIKLRRRSGRSVARSDRDRTPPGAPRNVRRVEVEPLEEAGEIGYVVVDGPTSLGAFAPSVPSAVVRQEVEPVRQGGFHERERGVVDPGPVHEDERVPAGAGELVVQIDPVDVDGGHERLQRYRPNGTMRGLLAPPATGRPSAAARRASPTSRAAGRAPRSPRRSRGSTGTLGAGVDSGRRWRPEAT